MARITRVPGRGAALSTKLAYLFVRRGMRQVAGRDLDGMIEPIEVMAHAPGLLAGYGKLEQAAAKAHQLDRRLRALAELKSATVVQCGYCIDIGSRISRQWGLSDDELLALPTYLTSPCFSELDRLVLDYAVAMTRTPADVSDELFAALARHLDEGQLVELTFVVAMGNFRARFNTATGIGAAGFSDGLVCAVPAPVDALA